MLPRWLRASVECAAALIQRRSRGGSARHGVGCVPTLSALEAGHARAVLQEQLLACACLNSFLFLKDLAFVCLSGRLGAKVCGRGFGARICVYACCVAVGRPQAFPRVSGARLEERGRHLAQTSLAVHNVELASVSSVGWIAASATGEWRAVLTLPPATAGRGWRSAARPLRRSTRCPQRRARVSEPGGVDRSDCVRALDRAPRASVARRHPAVPRLPLA